MQISEFLVRITDRDPTPELRLQMILSKVIRKIKKGARTELSKGF